VRCKYCITDEIWLQYLPSSLLKNCLNCGHFGYPNKKIFKIGGWIAVTIYLVVFIYGIFYK